MRALIDAVVITVNLAAYVGGLYGFALLVLWLVR